MGDAATFVAASGERGGRGLLQDALALTGYRRLRLPADLETAYQAHRQAISVANIRDHWPLVVAAVGLIAFFTFGGGIVDPAMRALVVFGYATIFAVVVLVAIGANAEVLQPHIDKLVGFAAFTGLLGMQVGAALAIDGSALRAIAEYGVIFITLAICMVSGLSFMQAIGISVGAAVAFVGIAAISANFPAWLDLLRLPTAFDPAVNGFAPDWQRFPFYGIGSVIIAGLIGVAREIRERTVYLQERLLVLEKKELDQLTRELMLISREDALTGLANRRHFDEVFAREWASCQREGVAMNLLFIDVDYFKRYNDHYGHQAGDVCLAAVGRALGNQALRGADFVARYGGEEFVGLFPRTNREGLEAIAARLLEAVDLLAMPHAASDVSPHVTISVGVASLAPGPGDAPERLLQSADMALYRAKQVGRHRYCTSWDAEPA